ncbi:hypothetical protein [Kangiella sediminilitoris]|uniref:Uncharacterized protein n=1 Tax=Kangiella sediminilitoris TaxID=1144748 RepID=A0A1B3BB10_9GAMM|nr:hypothetical protein [Kangiella sediminilitoris]AOE49978.1 hypothetical protein KS2013_1261 [Kangiella sediminilitoris]
MNNDSERELLDCLKQEFDKVPAKSVDLSQDATFQAQLEEHFSEREAGKPRTVKQWFAAAVVLIVIGFSIIIGYPTTSTTDNIDRTIKKFMVEANAIEQEIAGFETNQLSSTQYIEALKLRDEIGLIDESIQQIYSAGPGVSIAQLEQVWEEKLRVTKNLKALYINQYKVARI